MVWRTIRGMVNQKSARGADALSRLSTFEGIPAPYDKVKRVVIPAALRVLRLKSVREYTVLGDLADSVGWKHKALLKTLEDKRRAEAGEFFEKKKEAEKLKGKAIEAAVWEAAETQSIIVSWRF